MKRGVYLSVLMAFFAGVIMGCAGAKGVRDSGSEVMELNHWLETHAFSTIVQKLKTNSFMKGRPFLIVKTGEGDLSHDSAWRIDALTEDIRNRMITFFLKFPEIQVIRRHPAPSVDRPYTLQELDCGRFIDPKILMTIDIKALENKKARVGFRAVELNKGEWIRGFSLDQVVKLTSRQWKDFHKVHPDQCLRGLKYMPFTHSQRDEMGAYLARNLSCMFRQAYNDETFRVFVDASSGIDNKGDMAWFIRKQLQFCNEIQLTQNREEADWILTAESRRTGAESGLSQFWIEAHRKKNGDLVRGLATYAYFLSDDHAEHPLNGEWKIRNLPGGSVDGYMKITGNRDDGFRGDLFGPDGVSLISRGIFIQVNDDHVDWAYYDDRRHKTLKARGILVQNRKRISVKLSTYPSKGRYWLQEYVFKEVE